jgi:hypothetical protein
MLLKTLLSIALISQLHSPVLAETFFKFEAADLKWSAPDSGSVSGKTIVANKVDYGSESGKTYTVRKNAAGNLEATLPNGKLDFGVSAGQKLLGINFRDLDLLIDDQVNNLVLENVSFKNAQKGESTVDQLVANCSPILKEGSFLTLIFANCFTMGSATVSSAIFPDMLSFENARLKVENNNFTLNGNLIDPVVGSAKIKGVSKFDAATSVLTVEVKSAKLDVFNIRSRIFKELGKIKSETIKVKEPFIYITLKK